MTDNDVALLAVFLIAAVIGLFIYFIPTMVASHREHRNKAGIFCLNFFFGWTLLGWVGALIWALWNEKVTA